MRMQWDQLKTIKQKFKNVVSGYIRINIQPLFVDRINDTYYNIPELIYSLCLLFWYQAMNTFDHNLLSEIVEISNDNKTISVPSFSGDGVVKYCTCYGVKVISSMMNATYIWKFKNLSSTRNPNLFIGIAESEKMFINSKIIETDAISYTAYGSGSCRPSDDHRWYQPLYVKYCNPGSILTMRLIFDDNGGKLYYKNSDKNSKEQLVFDNIYKGHTFKYRMVVCLARNPYSTPSVELLHFEQT